MHNKLNFATRENIYKQFQEENKPDIFMETMRLLGTGITLTQARQMVIIDLNYNACLSNQVEKRISQIGQSNEAITYILVYTDDIIEQQIKKCHNKRQEIQKITMRKAWASGYESKLNVKIK